jgi:hypothetical protein
VKYRTIGHPTTDGPIHGRDSVGLQHKGECWHQPESPVILPFYLGKEGLNVVQIPAGFQPHLVGMGAIGPGSWKILNCLQSGTQSLINYLAKGLTKFCGNGFRLVQNIVVYVKCCSHEDIVASLMLMSRHQVGIFHSGGQRPEEKGSIRDRAFPAE